MKQCKFYINSFFAFLIFSAFVYISGCESNVVTNSNPVEQLSHSEQEFTDNSSLRANDSGVVVLNLEALNSPSDNIPDTYTRGIDIIPYYFSSSRSVNFKIGDSSYFSAKLYKESSGDTLFKLYNPGDSAMVNIQPGNYKLIVQSAYNYNVSPVENKTVFVQPSYTKPAFLILLKTNSCTKCDLRWVTFMFLNLRNARISTSDLSLSNFSFSNLSHARLDFTKMQGVSMIGTNLDSSDISNVIGVMGNFSAAKLNNANLSNSKFMFGTFSGAVIKYSNLSYTDMTGTNLCASEFSNNQTSGIRYNALTTCYP
ncbi:MAG: pentapeptide repeat-containing protein [Bacteroidetes bacterium]|nr:pentapeptide repeat-containing protein [Bacteroidota bacterium]